MTKEQMISYFKNGMENGLVTRIAEVTEKDGEVQIKGDYIKLRKDGYKTNNCGEIICRINTDSDNGKTTAVVIAAVYKGIEDGIPYDYAKGTAFKLTKNGKDSFIQKIESDSRTNEIKETCYKTYCTDSLKSYENSVNYSIDIVHEAAHLKQLAKRK